MYPSFFLAIGSKFYSQLCNDDRKVSLLLFSHSLTSMLHWLESLQSLKSKIVGIKGRKGLGRLRKIYVYFKLHTLQHLLLSIFSSAQLKVPDRPESGTVGEKLFLLCILSERYFLQFMLHDSFSHNVFWTEVVCNSVLLEKVVYHTVYGTEVVVLLVKV